MRNSILILCAICLSMACKKTSSSTPAPVTTTSTTLDTFTQIGTPYAGVPDTKDIVMYEVNPLTFSSTNNLAGVTARLDSIKALGVNVVWLMPTYPLGVVKTSHSPYCVKDYLSVNPLFGSLTDLQTLVSTAHSKGMAVIMDWVADQTSYDHAWITDHPNWYHKNAAGNIISPYTSASDTFSDVAWLDYSNATMRHAMLVSMIYWIKTANIDGYRCDFASNVPGDFWSASIDSLKMLSHKLIFLSENESSSDFTNHFQMDYSWGFYGALKAVFQSGNSTSTLNTQNANDNYAVTVSGDAKLRFITNHDEEQTDGAPPTIYGGTAGALAAFVVSGYMGGVPMIYNGNEVGNNVRLTMYQTGGPYTTIDWSTNHNITAAYEQLIGFRNTSDAVKTGGISNYINTDITVFKRYNTTDTVLVMVNTRSSSKTYNTAAFAGTWTDALADTSVTLPNADVTFAPYQYMVLKK